ncbi:hypothetical protein BJF79_40320 [Actinomadura sp. CNU-125]|uniref:delta-60 repeat domain-containing protein n=1 Tax=Actinomadura sp. CNU-125 TaxID=1904961 RepID=UPI0009607400|nr:delta-60 repeat domain-containing protein [Actinomadura sp. CNU-125]OLT29807.1 hypothetical protein BJF79_40320 [Actinomadura sp. CNU-125]
MRKRSAAAATLLGAALLFPTAAQADIAHSAVVSADPVDGTPHVLDGTVRAIAVVGSTVVVGGNFEQVREAGGGAKATARANLFAFDLSTGKISTTFVPKIDGTVYALQPGPDGTVYVGGRFKNVAGAATGPVARLQVSTGKVVTSFKPAVPRGKVATMVRRGNRLYIGGTFTQVAKKTVTGLARLNATTGALDPTFAITLSQPRAGTLKVANLIVNPQDTRLVVSGTFTRAAGKSRYQIAMIDTGAKQAAVTSWATEAYTSPCNRQSFDTYMRGMDFSPDGSYFVVTTTGGPYGPRQMCDTAARWETNKTGSGQKATWINHTGGDTLLSTAVTGAAVYVGGHQRWMDNPYGSDSPGPGSVARPGIAALNPKTGKALSWNPTRSRGHGVEALVATPKGLLVGSDTDELGHEFHGRIGMFPLR